MIDYFDCLSFFFNDTATTEIYTLSLHDALPICAAGRQRRQAAGEPLVYDRRRAGEPGAVTPEAGRPVGGGGRAHTYRASRERSEEQTSELQSRQYLVCRLLLEKKKPRDMTHWDA